MTYKEKLAELAAEPQCTVDYLMDMERKLEIFKRHILRGEIEPISEKDFRIPFRKI